MDNKMRGLILAGLFVLLAIFILVFSGCKPSIPVRADYPEDMYPCYLAEVCIIVNSYMVDNKVDCTLALQKCYRYADYKRCKTDPNPTQCWNDLGIRL